MTNNMCNNGKKIGKWTKMMIICAIMGWKETEQQWQMCAIMRKKIVKWKKVTDNIFNNEKMEKWTKMADNMCNNGIKGN